MSQQATGDFAASALPTPGNFTALPSIGQSFKQPGTVPTVAYNFKNKQNTYLAESMSANVAAQDAAAAYSAGAYAVGYGLSLAYTTGDLRVRVQPGQAIIEGVVELQSEYNLAVADNATNYIWLLQNGQPVATQSTTAPAAKCVYLGLITLSSGTATNVDYSGVLYSQGALIRFTGDLSAPTDAPPASVCLFTQTLAGLFFWDGYQHILVDGYNQSAFTPGTSGANHQLGVFVVTRGMYILPDFAGFYAYAGVAATASTQFAVRRNGVQIGTLTFGASGAAGTFAMPGGSKQAYYFAPGDRLDVQLLSAADATLADVGVSVAGVLCSQSRFTSYVQPLIGVS